MLARLDGFDAKSGRTRRKRYERRDDETRRCAAGRRFLFVAPFSVAHPCRQEKGIRLLFFLSPRLASCSLYRARIIRSYRIVSVPWKRCGEGVVAWGDTPRLVGGGILASRLSSRSSSRLGVSSSSPCSLVSSGRLVSAARRTCRVISVLFSSVLGSFVRCVSWTWERAASCHLRSRLACLVAACHVMESDWMIAAE